ncbi:EGF-containing fibulin-like extracellular matrix protein 1 precursor, partial [Leptotrombidium deliense]
TECVDIDECQKDASKYCDTCENKIGSFICGCKGGRELRNDGGQANCADINECLIDNTCKAEEICTNVSPGFRCTPTNCTAPYRREPHKPSSCFKDYSDKDKAKALMLHYHTFALKNNHTVPKTTGLPLYTIHIKDVNCKFTHKLEKVNEVDVEVSKTTKETWKLVEHGPESATLVLYSSLPG